MVSFTKEFQSLMLMNCTAACRTEAFHQSLSCIRDLGMVSTNPKNDWQQFGTTGNGLINTYLATPKSRCPLNEITPSLLPELLGSGAPWLTFTTKAQSSHTDFVDQTSHYSVGR